jgi:hypothetical protein
MDKEKLVRYEKKIIAVLGVIVIALVLIILQRNMNAPIPGQVESNQLQEALLNSMQKAVAKKGGKNLKVETIKPLTVSPRHALFYAKYSFDFPLEDGEATENKVETKMILDKLSDEWTFTGFQDFNSNTEFFNGIKIVAKPTPSTSSPVASPAQSDQ